MIDTVEILLHQAKTKHSYIWNTLINFDEGIVKGETYLGNRVVKHNPTFNIKNGTTREASRIHTKYIPSSHYEIVTLLDSKNDLIKFNFSVPKYFYGHNILQAVENVNETNFNMSRFTFHHQAELAYDRFRKYIRAFFNTEFSGYKLNFTDVQITRLDFCFNQYFDSKEQALSYLDQQKQIKKKHERQTSHSANYETSKFFHNKDFSCKIYHKGTEYAKNDSQQHLKINKKMNAKIFDVEHLQEYSDKILRYECSIRTSYFSYLYNNKIFRRNSAAHKKMLLVFNKLKTIEQMKSINCEQKDLANLRTQAEFNEFHTQKVRNKKLEVARLCKTFTIHKYNKDFLNYMHDIRKKQVGLLDSKELNVYEDDETKKFEYSQNTNAINTLNWFYDKFSHLITLTRKFYFSLDYNTEQEYIKDRTYSDNLFETVQTCKFGRLIFSKCLDFFHSFILDMKVQQRQSIDYYLEKVDSYNNKIKWENQRNKSLLGVVQLEAFKPKSSISKNKIALILSAASTYGFDTLQKQLKLSSRTWQRYQADLKKIGVTKQTLFHTENFNALIDFSHYFSHTSYNKHKLFFNDTTSKIFS